ncbi:MAG: homocysteine S-methyltransferase family protein [Sedimentisphaerales bacterium]|nr:homocysteine S-methyltransferase family protein [Sedimentisphaerales bacterium]
MDLLTAITTKEIFLLDGAIGTELDKRGLMGRAGNNIDNPDIVLEIQRQYAQCGCDALTTNTLTMNRIYIETHNMNVSVREINIAGVELAKKAVNQSQYVLGNMSSTGQLLEPYGSYTESQFHDTFREQAEILAQAGVDGILIETVFDLREAICALKACKENFSLPVIVSIAFDTEQKGGRTMMGDSAEQCAKHLTDAGADAVGANCGSLGPSQMAAVITELRAATSLPLLAQPNAGKPKLIGDKTVFEMAPEPFAAGISECIDAGANIVGGCCGTTPEHIRAVAEMLKQRQK